MGGTVPHVPGSLRVTENTHMSAAVLLSKLYGDLKCDVERENFHLLCENCIRWEAAGSVVPVPMAASK